MEDPLGAAPDSSLTRSDPGEHHRLAVVVVLLLLAAVPVLWLELVPLAWAAPFLLIYALVVVPVLVTTARRRRALL